MIISASRRTDIPNYYSDWFFNRLLEGFVYVRNPMNARQISKISLSPDAVDCIVFWTKNPFAMLPHLNRLKDYNYYFQFTLTGYGKDVEPRLPDKKKTLIPVFRELSEKIGKERVIWRYDPILCSKKYTPQYRLRAFSEIAECVCGYTEKVIVSFLDLYEKTKKNVSDLCLNAISEEEMRALAADFAQIAKGHSLQIETCAEQIDLSEMGIAHGHCVDEKLIERIAGYPLKGGKDKNQREECGCFESIDIGAYNTCLNGCKYCYANYSEERVQNSRKNFSAASPLLCGEPFKEDVIKERKVQTLKETQISFFDRRR